MYRLHIEVKGGAIYVTSPCQRVSKPVGETAIHVYTKWEEISHLQRPREGVSLKPASFRRGTCVPTVPWSFYSDIKKKEGDWVEDCKSNWGYLSLMKTLSRSTLTWRKSFVCDSKWPWTWSYLALLKLLNAMRFFWLVWYKSKLKKKGGGWEKWWRRGAVYHWSWVLIIVAASFSCWSNSVRWFAIVWGKSIREKKEGGGGTWKRRFIFTAQGSRGPLQPPEILVMMVTRKSLFVLC